jgi:CheY-like chemotaxis protein
MKDKEEESDRHVSVGLEEKSENPSDNPSVAQSIESNPSVPGRERKGSKLKPRITMFPQFEKQLNELKASATELLEQEDDPVQHEIILTQYAEASLTILRQLRYHCMNSGLDGWRQSGLTRKVLIVDDSLVTRKLVSRAFEKANFIVDTACNGAEGVEKLKTSLYDIAFMDIDMPVMNGFEATKRLREWEDVMRPGARQPICALTATYVDDFERSELMKFKDAGLDVMESKPCNIPRLFKVVDDVAPMFSDLSISIMQRERSDHSFHSGRSSHSSYSSL